MNPAPGKLENSSIPPCVVQVYVVRLMPYPSVPVCTRLYPSVLVCTRLYSSVICTRLYLSVLVSIRLYSSPPISTRLYPSLPVSTRLYPSLPVSTRLPISTHVYPSLPISTRLYPSLPVSTHLYPSLPTGIHLVSLLVPLLVSYLPPEQEAGLPAPGPLSAALHDHALQRVHHLGAAHPAQLRAALHAGPPATRARLEAAARGQHARRAAAAAAQRADGASDAELPAKPSIQLKTSFSNFNWPRCGDEYFRMSVCWCHLRWYCLDEIKFQGFFSVTMGVNIELPKTFGDCQCHMVIDRYHPGTVCGTPRSPRSPLWTYP